MRVYAERSEVPDGTIFELHFPNVKIGIHQAQKAERKGRLRWTQKQEWIVPCISKY